MRGLKCHFWLYISGRIEQYVPTIKFW